SVGSYSACICDQLTAMSPAYASAGRRFQRRLPPARPAPALQAVTRRASSALAANLRPPDLSLNGGACAVSEARERRAAEPRPMATMFVMRGRPLVRALHVTGCPAAPSHEPRLM